jgi:enoyl-CoA hydratase/carnithine racemase
MMRWATETAEMIAANSRSAVQAVKRQVSATIADHALTREAFEQELGDAVRTSPHFAEGIAAFREKRPPRLNAIFKPLYPRRTRAIPRPW